jgi:hypothetical protein
VLGKLAVELAPPEPELQHAALRLTARGWETAPLPAPDGSGALVAALDLRAHEAVVEHDGGAVERVPLTPDRPVAEVTRDVLAAVATMVGEVRINPAPQEVPWHVPLDHDYDHARYDTGQVRDYFAAATQAALALAAFRAPYRGRCTPVNAWWGRFDLAVTMFSGMPADPGSDDYIARNADDAEEVMVGWSPGNANHPDAAFYAFSSPVRPSFAAGALSPASAHWDKGQGEYIFGWDDARAAPDPRAAAVEFANSAFQHACRVSGWDPALPGSTAGRPPPIR